MTDSVFHKIFLISLHQSVTLKFLSGTARITVLARSGKGGNPNSLTLNSVGLVDFVSDTWTSIINFFFTSRCWLNVFLMKFSLFYFFRENSNFPCYQFLCVKFLGQDHF